MAYLRFGLACLIASALIPDNGYGTTVERMDDTQLAQTAELIVEGTCTDVSGTWIDGTLYTLATVTVAESLKGAKSGDIVVAIPGGVDLDRDVPIAYTVPGAPSIETGEQMLLYLVGENAVPGSYAIAGFFQGKFTIVDGPDGTPLAVGGGKSRPLPAVKKRIRQITGKR